MTKELSSPLERTVAPPFCKFLSAGEPASRAGDKEPTFAQAGQDHPEYGKYWDQPGAEFDSSTAGLAWLPADVRIDEPAAAAGSSSAGCATFTSYINNLHPRQHPELYSALGELLSRMVPLMEAVLVTVRTPRPQLVKEPASWWEYGEFSDEEDELDFTNEFVFNEHRTFVPPTHVADIAPPPPEPSPPFSLHQRNLQVILKMAEIRLTPEKPAYPGGAWHIEGMRDEAIVATSIYYVACENVTTSRLAFREQVEEPDYEQYDDVGVAEMYELHDEQALNQSLGECTTSERRLLAWPNTLQHRVAPFELIDATQPGRRAIVVAFLVDPYVRVVSTAAVAPQQRAWLVMELRALPLFFRLPRDCFDKIVSFLADGMTFEAAAERRKRLMAERKFFVQGANEQWFERPFSLCEH